MLNSYDPEGLGAGWEFGDSVVVAAQLGQELQEVRQHGRFLVERLLLHDAPDRLPFAVGEHGGARELRARPVQVRQNKIRHAMML